MDTFFSVKGAYENGARAVPSVLNFDCDADKGRYPSFAKNKVSLCPFWVLSRLTENPEAYRFGAFLVPVDTACTLICYLKYVRRVPHGRYGSLLTIRAEKCTGAAEVLWTNDTMPKSGLKGAVVIDVMEKGNNAKDMRVPEAFLFSGQIEALPAPGASAKQAFAYTDGSFRPDENGIPCGGYGYTLTYQGQEYAGAGACATESNNIDGEVHGVIEAVKKAVALGAPSVTIFHDYEHLGNWAVYMPNTEKAGAKKIGAKPEKPIAKLLYDELGRLSAEIKITFIKIQGHAGIPGNVRADELAKEAATEAP